MTQSRVFNTAAANNHLEAKVFLDPKGGPMIARYEEVRYPQFETFTENQLAFFWKPEEIDVTKDKLDFRDLPPEQEHIFTSNLKRQTMLDSINGRGPNLAFLPIVSLPEAEVWMETWGQNETLHSRAYTHVIRNVYPDPSKVFDEISDIEEIMECAADIAKYYDDLIRWNAILEVYKSGMSVDDADGEMIRYDEHEHKKALWLALNAVNALEGIRFYVSFACSWNFAEQKKMEGNANIIRLICRDENLHLGSTQYMLRMLPKDDPAFERIKEDTRDEVTKMFMSTIQQEKEWADYLFKHGSMIGLNAEILHQYVDWIASRRMRTIGLAVPFDHPTSDPLPWTKNWISGKEVQKAPQEAEITSYLVSSVERDIDEDVLDDLSL